MTNNYNIKQGLRNIKERGLASALQEDWYVTKERFLDFCGETFRGIVLLAQPVTLYQEYRKNKLLKIPARERLQLLK